MTTTAPQRTPVEEIGTSSLARQDNTNSPVPHKDSPPPTSTTEQKTSEAAAAKPRDPRRAALLRFAISISVLNLVGHILLGFEQPPIAPILAILVGYGTAFVMESVDSWARGVRPEFAGGRDNLFYFLLPPHIAALACSMLLYATSVRFYLFATVVAVVSKYIFRLRVKGRLKHFLNPSNTGIAVTLLLFPVVGFTPPYMFTNNVDNTIDWLLPLGVLMAGTMLNAKLTQKAPLILAWVGGYVLQAVVRQVLFDDPFWATVGMMTGVAFVLFTNYMITDPGTTPRSRRGQVAFGLTAATVYGVLISAQVSYAIFFALVITCALRGAQLYLTERFKKGNNHA